MNNLLLITGAGASNDIIDISRVPFKNRIYRPPLTKDLFSFDVLNWYSAQCLQKHPVASQVGHQFYNRFGEGSEASNLEKFLKEIKNDESPTVSKQFWAVPLYFLDLFQEISRHYTPTNTPGLPSNYKSLIDEISKSDYDQVIWLNLNYDLLADFAIKSTYNTLEKFSDYMNLVIPGKKSIKLKYTKPHGSIDWFKPINEKNIDLKAIQSGLGAIPDNFGDLISEEVIKAPVIEDGRVVGRMPETYPAITAPMGEYKFIYQSHIEQIIPHLKETDTVLCIGFSALDNDILDLINKNIPEIKKMKIVNGHQLFSGQAYDRIHNYCKRTKIVPKDSSLFDSTFGKFMQREAGKWLSEGM